MLAPKGVMDELPLLEMKRTVGTRAYAVARPNTPFFKVDHIGLVPLALGVVAPPAVQGTALEKHRRSDSRSVVEREVHDVQHETDRGPRGGQVGMALRGGFVYAVHVPGSLKWYASVTE
jgi:hypothetical protein